MKNSENEVLSTISESGPSLQKEFEEQRLEREKNQGQIEQEKKRKKGTFREGTISKRTKRK